MPFVPVELDVEREKSVLSLMSLKVESEASQSGSMSMATKSSPGLRYHNMGI